MKLHSICIDQQKNLIVKYELTKIEDTDYFIDDFLKEAGFEKRQNEYVYSNKDIIEFNKRIKWVAEKFNNDFGPKNVNICDQLQVTLQSLKETSDLFERTLSVGEKIKNNKTHNPKIGSNFKRS